jgi:putative tributyrin esterase
MTGGATTLLALMLAAAPLAAQSQHGTVATAEFFSAALGARKRYLVYLPPSYAAAPSRRYPVAYYLHGAWGAETDWVQQGHLDETLDSLIATGMPEMIVVMPDGDDGFYTDWVARDAFAGCRADTGRREPASTYCVPIPDYEEYIAQDLVTTVDAGYRTLADRAHRGIAGLSMGGYGALTLALKHPELFSAAASHSGVLSPMYDGPHPFVAPPRYAATEAALRASWGGSFWTLISPKFGTGPETWRERDPAVLARALLARDRGAMPALWIDVGSEDGLVDECRAFSAELIAIGIPHHYAEHPGAHEWTYWRSHSAESLPWLAGLIAR